MGELNICEDREPYVAERVKEMHVFEVSLYRSIFALRPFQTTKKEREGERESFLILVSSDQRLHRGVFRLKVCINFQKFMLICTPKCDS